MPKERKKVLCMDAQRHAEYYGMQRIFDELYAKSKDGETFTGLMELVLSPDNIMLAYRNIKTNTGSYTAGTDKQNIGDIGRLPPAEVIGKVRKIVTGSEHGYRPKPVRRKDIPKPNGKTRPLGIPCIWDRLVQQCIKQILEPICEAKFSNNSYGFRPNRSVEHAISRTYSLLQRAHLHYVLEFDIKGFFDNVNHSKLIKQLWTLGIQDKQLLFVIRRILKAPIRMPDGSTVYPTKGTPQGGIISPLLANVVLNELDHWIDSQWTEHPVANRYGTWRTIRTSEVFDKSNTYGGRLPYHVRVLWDEAANTGQVPGLEKIVAVIRSREISLTLFYQAMSQCKALYKDHSETIMGNMDSIVFLGGREASTLKDISENWLGKATISMQTEGRSRGQSESYSQNMQRLGRELMTTSEITTMPGDKCILQLRGLPPFLSPKYDLKKHPNYKYTAEFDKKKNAFRLESLFRHRPLRLKPEDEYTVYEVDGSDTDEEADLLNFDDLDSDEFV